MATYQSSAVSAQATNIPAGGGAHVAKVVLDFSSTNLGTSESIDVLEVPADTAVIGAWLEVTTAGTGGDLDLGDDSDPNRYVAAHDGTSAVVAPAAGTAGGWVHNANDHIVVTNGASDAFDGVIKVVVVMTPIGGDPTAATFA
jgi:hypothetical protein